MEKKKSLIKKAKKKTSKKVVKKQAKSLRTKYIDSNRRLYNFDYDEEFTFEVDFNGHSLRFSI